MTAAPAVGEPPPNLTTSALPSFTNDDDEGPFSPIIYDSPFAFIKHNSRGTQHHVEKHVTNFHTQRSAAAHHHDSRRSALLLTTPHYTANAPNTGVYAPFEHSAFNRNKKQTDLNGHATPAAYPTPLVNSTTSHAINHTSYTQPLPVSSPDPWINSLLALQRQILQDLTDLKPTSDSNANTNPLLTPPTMTTPTTTTTMTTRLPSMVWMPPTVNPPPPHHCTNPKAPSQPPNTHLATLTDPPDGAITTLEALQHQILCDMQDLDRILRAIPLPPPPTPSPQLHPCSNPTPSPPPATTAHDSSVPGPTPTRQLPQPHLTVTARMILNNTRQNSTPWTPNALQHGIQHPTLKPCQLPHFPEPAKGPPTLSPYVPVGAYNSPVNNYTNRNHTTALATSFPWQATCQHHYQHPPFIPWATNIKALAHNMRPP